MDNVQWIVSVLESYSRNFGEYYLYLQPGWEKYLTKLAAIMGTYRLVGKGAQQYKGIQGKQ